MHRFEPLVEGMSVRSTKPVVLSQSRVDLRDFGVIPAVVDRPGHYAAFTAYQWC